MGHLSKWPEMAFFGVFSMFLAKNFLAAPKMSKIGRFCSKKESHFSKFSAPPAPKNGSYIDLGHPLFAP